MSDRYPQRLMSNIKETLQIVYRVVIKLRHLDSTVANLWGSLLNHGDHHRILGCTGFGS